MSCLVSTRPSPAPHAWRFTHARLLHQAFVLTRVSLPSLHRLVPRCPPYDDGGDDDDVANNDDDEHDDDDDDYDDDVVALGPSSS